MTKTCTKCNKIKELSEFPKNCRQSDGYRKDCKDCRKLYRLANKKKISAQNKKYYNQNKKVILKQNAVYRETNKETISKQKKEYRLTNINKIKEQQLHWRIKNRDVLSKKSKEYYNKNKSIINAKRRLKRIPDNRYNESITYNINRRMSSSINRCLKENNFNKNNTSWLDYVDYTINDLINHLESQFQDGMSWENRSMWHIDHIKPKSLFKYSSPNDEQFKECWALENLQPLWAFDNISKHNKY